MEGYFEAARVGQLADPGKCVVDVDGRMVALFHVAGSYFALDDVCTHDGGPLAEGELCGFEIACPRHGAKFDVRTGKALCMPATRATVAHPVMVRDGRVWVKLGSIAAN
jgi:3-phenylpropionate/trans-cinnamate dioxygenase ferredoxin subunit